MQVAFTEFGNADYTKQWTEWLRDSHDLTFPELPPGLAKVVLEVLVSHNAHVVAEIESGSLAERAMADLDNDLTVTQSIAETSRKIWG